MEKITIFKLLLDKLEGAGKLEELWINSVSLEKISVRQLADVVGKLKLKRLTYVKSKCNVDELFTRKSISSLESLVLNETQLTIEAIKAFVDTLKNLNCKLAILSLAGCGLTAEAAELLYEALTINTSLTTIHLNGNGCGSKSLKSLSQALVMNSSLSTLNVRGSALDDVGISLLVDAIFSNNFF